MAPSIPVKIAIGECASRPSPAATAPLRAMKGAVASASNRSILRLPRNGFMGALIRTYNRLLATTDRKASRRAMVFITYSSSASPFSSRSPPQRLSREMPALSQGDRSNDDPQRAGPYELVGQEDYS